MTRTGRRFNLIDGMALVAATACGISAGRAQLAAMAMPGAWWGVEAHHGAVWFALIWASALVLIQLRGGRSSRRWLTRRPGFTAALASLSGLAMLLAMLLAEKLVMWGKTGVPPRLEAADFHERLFSLLTLATPCTVAAAWASLAVGGRWRPARDWVDRLGILLGLYWVTYGVVASVLLLGV